MRFLNSKLKIENTVLQNIATKYGTPAYCYSYKQLRENINDFKKNFKSISPLICFAIKSNTCLLYTSPSPRDRQKSRMPSSA